MEDVPELAVSTRGVEAKLASTSLSKILEQTVTLYELRMLTKLGVVRRVTLLT